MINLESSPAKRDIRSTATYREAQDFFATTRRPGTRRISDASELDAATDGTAAVFVGHILESLDAPVRTQICHVDLASGRTRILTSGANGHRNPKFSPDGRLVAFLADRGGDGDFQLYILDPATGAAQPTARVDGWVEYLDWSPDGGRILLGVADHGADVAAAHGAVSSRPMADALPSWLPTVDAGSGGDRRGRRAWVYSLIGGDARPAGTPNQNVWEAVWCGDGALAAVVSAEAGEGFWYGARLATLRFDDNTWREIFAPQDQLGWPAASPAGRHLVVVEAVCSDRWIVAGDLRSIDIGSGAVLAVQTNSVDISHVEWRSDRRLLVAGQRGLETVVGLCDLHAGTFAELWGSFEIGTAGRLAAVSGFGDSGDCAMICEGFRRAPEIATIRNGQYRTIVSFDLGYGEYAAAIVAVDQLRWTAPDGLEIEGWLLRPRGSGPHRVVMNVHGGPILLWRAMWLGRSRYAPLCLLLQRGYAVFLPNPRGSSGRGRDFARRVVGDMGGADALDLLAGLDHLVTTGLANATRIGVTGVSYGGFMTCRLITQDERFAAAVPIAPMTNFVTEHLLSNIPHFVQLFLQDDSFTFGGPYFARSPLLQAHKVTTPTLTVCGALDRCTPPAEAAQFHAALTENGGVAMLACYPEEGHGIERLPAAIDFAARMIDWFERFMPGDTALLNVKEDNCA